MRSNVTVHRNHRGNYDVCVDSELTMVIEKMWDGTGGTSYGGYSNTTWVLRSHDCYLRDEAGRLLFTGGRVPLRDGAFWEEFPLYRDAKARAIEVAGDVAGKAI